MLEFKKRKIEEQRKSILARQLQEQKRAANECISFFSALKGGKNEK